MAWSESEARTGAPACPTCGRPMKLRHMSQQFTCTGAIGFGGYHELVTLSLLDAVVKRGT